MSATPMEDFWRIVLSMREEIAVHGIAIMSVREGLEFETQIVSDTAALNSLVDAILAATLDVHVFRDPTRGGITSALSEGSEKIASSADSRAIRPVAKPPFLE